MKEPNKNITRPKFPKRRISDNLAGALSAACILAMIILAYFAANWLASFVGFVIGIITASFMGYTKYKSKYYTTFVALLFPGILVVLLLTQPSPINTLISAAAGALLVLFGTMFRGKIPDLDALARFIVGE